MSVLSVTSGNARAALRQRKDDLYETPEVAVDALLRVENLPHNIWECACGPGKIVRVLRRHGHHVVASDLVDYGLEDSQAAIDFLMERRCPEGTELILTNPPYKLAAQFVEHGLSLCPRVVMLLRLGFLESESRSKILDSGHLARIHVFKKRLPMMHRDNYSGPRASSAIAFAWYCWDKTNRGPTQVDRISWRGI